GRTGCGVTACLPPGHAGQCDSPSRLLGVRWGEERSWSTGRETRETVRLVEQPYVPASVMEDLDPGSAQLRVPNVDGRRTRVEPVRVAMPSLIGRGRAGRPTQWEKEKSADLPESSSIEELDAAEDEIDEAEEALAGCLTGLGGG